MTEHESVRQLLALSAAGLLDAGEERLVREHVGQCAQCAANLDDYLALSAGLSELPAPHPSADLVSRTAMLLAAEADRRQGAVFAAVASIFALVFVLLLAAYGFAAIESRPTIGGVVSAFAALAIAGCGLLYAWRPAAGGIVD